MFFFFGRFVWWCLYFLVCTDFWCLLFFVFVFWFWVEVLWWMGFSGCFVWFRFFFFVFLFVVILVLCSRDFCIGVYNFSGFFVRFCVVYVAGVCCFGFVRWLVVGCVLVFWFCFGLV